MIVMACLQNNGHSKPPHHLIKMSVLDSQPPSMTARVLQLPPPSYLPIPISALMDVLHPITLLPPDDLFPPQSSCLVHKAFFPKVCTILFKSHAAFARGILHMRSLDGAQGGRLNRARGMQAGQNDRDGGNRWEGRVPYLIKALGWEEPSWGWRKLGWILIQRLG